MTKYLLMFLTLLFCASSQGVSFHRCTKPDGEVMYSNVPCECIQFSDQNRAYNSKCALTSMPTAAQQERALKRKQELDTSSAKMASERAETRRIEDAKRQLEDEKKVAAAKWDRQIEDAQNSIFTARLVPPLLMLKQQELEKIDRKFDQYRSPEEVASLEENRARAQQNRKNVAEQLRQNRQEQRSKEMERKINDIADKLGIW